MQPTGPPERAAFLCSKTGRDKTVKIFRRILVSILAAALLAAPAMRTLLYRKASTSAIMTRRSISRRSGRLGWDINEALRFM